MDVGLKIINIGLINKIMVPAKSSLLIVCCVAITLSFCNSNHQEKKPDSFAALDTSVNKLGKTVNGLGRTIAFLDSNLKYARLAKEMEIKMVQAEADYYRTADEKYYKLYYKYQRRTNHYIGIANRYYDSLKAK